MSQNESRKIRLNEDCLRNVIHEIVREVVMNDLLFKGTASFPAKSAVRLPEKNGFGECYCLLPGTTKQKVFLNVSNVVDRGEIVLAIDVTHGEEDGYKFAAPAGLRRIFSLEDEKLVIFEDVE